MVTVRRPIAPEFGSTTPIKYPDSQGGATGFFFNHDGETYLVTNRHVFEPEEFTPLEIRIWLRDYENELNTNHLDIEIYNNGSANWYGHPDSDDIDIAVLPIDPVLSTVDDMMAGDSVTGSLAFTEDYFIPDAVTLNGSEAIVGYPGDFMDRTTFFPVRRNAVIASPYGIDFEDDPCFVTDARMHPGTSGSPILLTNPLQTKEGYSLSADQSKEIYLLGVHSATFYEDDIEDGGQDEDEWRYDLNLGWYPELLTEILEQVC